MKQIIKKFIKQIISEEIEEEKKKFTENIRKDLYKKQKDIDCRFGIDGLEDILEGMSSDERQDFYSQATQVFNNPSFKKICDYVYVNNWDYALKNAKSKDELAFYRGVVSGSDVLYSAFKKYDNIYKENIKKQKEIVENDKENEQKEFYY